MSRRIGGAVAVIAVALASLTACSSGSSGASPSADTTPTTAARTRPDGPAAALSQEITGGKGVFIGEAEAPDLAAAGYEQHEYVASGTASSYTADGPIPADGRVAVREDTTADYRTRILVRRPSDPNAFDGTVVVEWLNVSGGVDAGPDFTFMGPELMRSGAVWVGVSAQLIGVEGGTVAVTTGVQNDAIGKGLVKIDPARYGTLDLPGDSFSYDIYTQVARALRGDGGDAALAGLRPERILGIGESQSAFALTTYVDAVHPVANAYDGFLLHSRGGFSFPLAAPSGAADIAGSISNPSVQIRTDLDVPVMMLETENDLTSVIGYYAARQDDTDHIRTWEMAGTAHADTTVMGSFASSLPCGAPINNGPQRFVVRAALRALDTWVRTGDAPPSGPRLQITTQSGGPTIVRDERGNALGGIRLAQIEVPVGTLSGEKGPTGGAICMLSGTSIPFTSDQLAQLYPSTQSYLDRYAAATDAAIAAGFALPEDRAEMQAEAQPEVVPS